MNGLLAEILAFNDARKWREFHTPKDLAISITLEASELLEHFQWRSSTEAVVEKREQIIEELADVIVYTLLLANELSVDVESAVRQKLKLNGEKYPLGKE